MSDRFRDISVFCENFGALEKAQQLEVNARKWEYEAHYWLGQFDKAKEREKQLKEEISELKSKLKLREKQLFERKSEKGKGKKNETSDCSKDQSQKKPRGQQPGQNRTNSTRRDYSHLCAKEEKYAVDQEDQFCHLCGKENPLINSEDASEIIEVEVKAHRRKIIKQKRRKGCDCNNGLSNIITAKGPGRLLFRSPYGVSIWVSLLLNKFKYCLPVNRSLHQYADIGLDLPVGTLTDGFSKLVPLFAPIYERIKEHNLKSNLWGGDETGFKVFITLEGKVGPGWQLWVFHSAQAVVYLLSPSRAATVPLAYFSEQMVGILVVDRYSAYKKFAKEHPLLRLAFCWSHVRRDFLDCAAKWPKLESWALDWVEEINLLFHYNNQRRAVFTSGGDYQEQQQQVQEHLKHLESKMEQELSKCCLPPGKSSLMESLKKHWEGLSVFVNHPEVPMDNYASERALRLAKLILKNSYGCRSTSSVGLTESLLSIFATLKLWNINARTWLSEYLQACAQNKGKVLQTIDAFIPWSMNATQRQRFESPLDLEPIPIESG